jgi:putative spermidine/putrescine transport system substrate-binding protein
MSMDTSRRRFMGQAGALTAAGLAGGLPTFAHGQQGTQLMVVQWGAAWIDASKKLVEAHIKQTGDRIAWELHAGGAMAIVAKVKPAWPKVPYHVISCWDPVFRAMINEDWLEPVSRDEMPNLRDIPDRYFQKDAKGRFMSVPLSTAGAFWGYRTDLVDKPIENVEQLLEPRFKGKICVPFPVNLTGLLMVTLALQRGGNERNIEPGWDFLKELAKRGNIGRVINNNSEFINAMSSGELSVAFFNNGGWSVVKSRFPVRIMSRIQGNRGFLYNEGFAILKSDRVAAAKRFANYFAGAEVNEQYNLPLSSGPTNSKAKPNPALSDMYYKPDELEKFAYFADFEYLSSQVNAWTKRWETEIVPLLRT